MFAVRLSCFWLLFLSGASLPAGVRFPFRSVKKAFHLEESVSPLKLSSKSRLSSEFPSVPLLEEPPDKSDPLPEELDTSRLSKLLGGEWDRKFLSVRRPLDALLHPNGSVEWTSPGPSLGVDLLRLATGEKVNAHAGKRFVKKAERLLSLYTRCPVQYRWTDLGVRFWPRWLRQGSCFQGRSCSLPPGMNCHPSSAVYKSVLRWVCGHKSESPCRWLPVQYPVLLQCSCRC